jgi:hypothetical protein
MNCAECHSRERRNKTSTASSETSDIDTETIVIENGVGPKIGNSV